MRARRRPRALLRADNPLAIRRNRRKETETRAGRGRIECLRSERVGLRGEEGAQHINRRRLNEESGWRKRCARRRHVWGREMDGGTGTGKCASCRFLSYVLSSPSAVSGLPLTRYLQNLFSVTPPQATFWKHHTTTYISGTTFTCTLKVPKRRL